MRSTGLSSDPLKPFNLEGIHFLRSTAFGEQFHMSCLFHPIGDIAQTAGSLRILDVALAQARLNFFANGKGNGWREILPGVLHDVRSRVIKAIAYRHIMRIFFLPDIHDKLVFPNLSVFGVKIHGCTILLLTKIILSRRNVLMKFRFDEAGYRNLRHLFGASAFDALLLADGTNKRYGLIRFARTRTAHG